MSAEVIHPSLRISYENDAKSFGVPYAELSDYLKYLHEGDWIHSAGIVALKSPTSPFPPEEALMRLTNAPTYEEIGLHGTVMAATSLPENAGKKETELFKDAVFGRDSLIVGLYLQELYPQLMQTTILELAKRQCRSNSNTERNDGTIGKIPHEDRKEGDSIRAGLEQSNNWGFPYYGSEDATPLYVKAIASHVRFLGLEAGEAFLNTMYEGQDKKEHTIRESLELAVQYIKGKMDENSQGLLEFKRTNPGGLGNQAWKDSWDSYFHADGTIANHENGIASIEIQGYAYDALVEAAELFPQQSWELRSRALHLKRQVFDTFWIDERGGYFALGTDRDENGNLRPMKIKTSNMGHLLNSRLLDGNDLETVYKRNAVIRGLFSDDMMSESGIRTLSSDEKIRFKPTAYHNGTVWPHDNYFIAQGLEHHGAYGLARYLYRKIKRIHHVTGKYPETVQGNGDMEPKVNGNTVVIFSSRDHRMNCIEQVPQEVQAWALAAVIASIEKTLTVPLYATDLKIRPMEKALLLTLRNRRERMAVSM